MQQQVPITHLQQVLQYLKQGHPVLPSQPPAAPQPNLTPAIAQVPYGRRP